MESVRKLNRESLYVMTIAIGLPISAYISEWPVNIWCIGLFIFLFNQAEKKERIEMLVVLAFATPMELFFSEVWLIYEYQRQLMPLYVPVGHWFLFDLGRRIAAKLPAGRKIASWIVLPFIPLTILMAYSGVDTSGILLLIIMFGFVRWGPAPMLYAVMGWLALGMELWGTWLGTWEWATNVPWTGLTAWNPPLLCGAFYALGDVLVNLSTEKIEDAQNR
ncbi:MAG: hypothetical protein VYB27_08560 [Candidatus Thermoplasmatota archaeon]|nr:hypothetical protein [Candidatus Thermoplasmatota archaeon]MEC7437123.1 hypothetical protein [Candidatus Thermoplasmatota archaeon]MEC7601757.1 hypothetical protein [Candidatus Thermoplasmatota archaeon]MEC9174641.1 hypothetical protein [Candidatus Thermoplasmatota archaeon]